MQLKNNLIYAVQRLLYIFNHVFSVGIDEDKIYREHINDGANILDVGSNVGSYINKISSIGKDLNLNIHAFEINKDLCELKPRILKSNKHNLKLNNVAISSKSGKEMVYINSISSQSSLKKASPKLGKIITETEIDSITLDLYCSENEIQFIDLLKIDVEGMEMDALKSAKQLLSEKKIKILKIEILTINFYEAFDYLNNYDYLYLGMNNQTYLNNKLDFGDYFFMKK